MKNLIILLSLVLSTQAFSSKDTAYSGFIKKMDNLEISTVQADKTSISNLETYLQSRAIELDKKKLGADKKLKEQIEEFETYYELAQEFLEGAKNAVTADKALRSYFKSLRVMYSIESTQAEHDGVEIGDIFDIIKRVDTLIPYIRKGKRDDVIGEEQAAKESLSLVDPATNNPITINEMKSMTYNEVSKLDIPKDHAAWYQEASRISNSNAWNEIERWAEKNQWKALKKKFKKKGISGDKYKIHKARRVLFFDEIKTTATSPKVKTKDAYGESWKLKWGNEVQTEPVANRLVMKLGAKFTDLVYANEAGADGVVLVLNADDEVGSCENINTLSLLKECLKKSVYEFNINSYIAESGEITNDNIDLVLKNLQSSGVEKYRKENLVGRTYVTFKESMVEFKSDRIMTRLGAIAGSFLGARRDRVARGNLLFSAFIGNIDQKDINGRTVIAKKFTLAPTTKYMEFSHDLGASLGSPGKSMFLNGLEYGSDFIKRPFFDRDHISIEQFMLYRPKAWDKITFADALWMARKIVSLTKSDFEEVVKYTHWPAFMQKAFVQKMQLRRNRIAKVFDIEDLLSSSERDISNLEIKKSLRTKLDREEVAKEFSIPLSEIESLLKRGKYLDKHGYAKYDDILVKKNQVVSCTNSIIMNLLEKHNNPSGLVRRQQRRKDDKALGYCHYMETAKKFKEERD